MAAKSALPRKTRRTGGFLKIKAKGLETFDAAKVEILRCRGMVEKRLVIVSDATRPQESAPETHHSAKKRMKSESKPRVKSRSG
jgi:hypothetical protein